MRAVGNKGKRSRTRRLVSIGFLVTLIVSFIFYLQFRAVSDLMLEMSISNFQTTTTPLNAHHFPSVRVIRATDLLQEERTPRELKNQEQLLQVHNCSALQRDDTMPQTTTLVTQLSVERFWLIQKTCQERWTQDPIVATIYFHSTTEYEQHRKNLQRQLVGCAHVYLIYYIQDDDDDASSSYPINLLRNLALQAVQTSHVLVYDADFLPSQDLRISIRTAWEVREQARRHTGGRPHEALVVPALQFVQNATTDIMQHHHIIPSTFAQVVACVKLGACSTFDENFNLAHGATGTDLWFRRDWYEERNCHESSSQRTVNDLKYVPCIGTPSYEPYLVLPWCASGDHSSRSNNNNNNAPLKRLVPYYDERFVGYGWNKIQFMRHLRHLGFLLWVLPAGFLMHVPHAPSAAHRNFTAGGMRQTVRQVYNEFEKELEEIYPWRGEANLRTCQHWSKHFSNLTLNEAFCKAYA